MSVNGSNGPIFSCSATAVLGAPATAFQVTAARGDHPDLAERILTGVLSLFFGNNNDFQ